MLTISRGLDSQVEWVADLTLPHMAGLHIHLSSREAPPPLSP
jgi:hypothetical protein